MTAQVTTTAGSSFQAAPGQSLLDAALQAGIVLDHSCRTGRCGSCTARVIDGATRALGAEMGLSASQAAQGCILTCMRAAQGERLLLEVDALQGLVLPAARLLPCKIDSLELLRPGILQVRLRLPPQQPLHWLAGQYVDITGPGGVRRSYSIANAPAAGSGIELHVAQVAGGALSGYWFERARPGDLLRLHGPLGSAVLRQPPGDPLVLLATGTGIAPIKAMLEDLAARPADGQRPHGIHLFWGAQRAADLYWDPRTLPLPLHWHPVLSREDAGWTGRRGWVQQAALESGVPWAQTTVHACGSPRMVDDARLALVAAGLDPRRFHADAFLPSS